MKLPFDKGHRRSAGVSFLVAAASLAAAAGLYEAVAPAGATASVWYVSRSPKLAVHVAAGCPRSVRGYQDVVNTFPGPPLVPANPLAGLVCSYKSVLSSSASAGVLAKQLRLSTTEARQLATAVRKLDLAAPSAAHGAMASCPAAFGSVALIGFSYPHRSDVGLWYETSGCQTLDNGRLGSFEAGNPSFYDGFTKVVSRFLPASSSFVFSIGPLPVTVPPRAAPLPLVRVRPPQPVRSYAVAG